MLPERVVATDTGASITQETANKMGVALIPLRIVWTDRSQDTDFTVTHQSFYERMEREGIPTTSGATPQDFITFYEQLHKQGAKEIVSVHITGMKSITCASAMTAAVELMDKYGNLKIEVIDSKTLSTPQRWLVEAAQEMLSKGFPLEQISKEVSEFISLIKFNAAVKTLENLRKSRRVKGIQALAASLLQLLPVIEVSEEGDLEVIAKVRGPRAGRRKIVELIKDDIAKRGPPEKFGIAYAGDPSAAEELERATEDIWQKEEVSYYPPVEVGYAVGAHAGPGTSAVFALWAHSEDIF